MTKTIILKNYIFWAYGISTLIMLAITIQFVSLGPAAYNNYCIFRSSFPHLLAHTNLYTYYPKEHNDLYKYSPSFAVLMAPFYYMPDFAGLFFWNLLNCLPIVYGILALPFLSPKFKLLALALVFPELIIAIQNSQSNGLTAGLALLAFLALEQKAYARNALFVQASAFIKLFGGLSALLVLLYRGRLKAILWNVILFVAFLLLPLIVVSPASLIQQYRNWAELLAADHVTPLNLSFMHLVRAWFHVDVNFGLFQAAGIVLLLLPLLRFRQFRYFHFRLNYLAYLLIWSVIFNHKAESPTFVIALLGISMWFVYSERKPWQIALLVLSLLLASFTPTDLFPAAVRDHIVKPYVLKALPCILIWIALFFSLVKHNFIKSEVSIEPLRAQD